MKEYSFTINGRDYRVSVNSVDDAKASVSVNGKEYEVTFSGKEQLQAPKDSAAAASAPAAMTAAASKAKKISSPLPGIIVELCVSAGQSVKSGQKVAVLEAMKMENDILAECDGTVSQVFVSMGDSVLEGAPIVEIM